MGETVEAVLIGFDSFQLDLTRITLNENKNSIIFHIEMIMINLKNYEIEYN
jgi:hypothetical protein